MTPSMLDPHSPAAHSTNHLWWALFSSAAAVCVVIYILLAVAIARGKRNGAKRSEGDTASSRRLAWVLGAGGIFPALVLVTLFVVTAETLRQSDARADAARQTIRVVGHQYWWEVDYATPSGTVTTANEIHIPVGKPMRLLLESADVNHSWWVPQLGPKMDLIPGVTNHTVLQANTAGSYHGQCAEFCGLQHAHMAFQVIAEPQQDYDAWLAAQAQSAATPTEPAAATGQQLFMTQPCVGCHTIRGTQAQGTKGPDLTHVRARKTLAGNTIPNTPADMTRWIQHAQSVKPGALMPDIQLSDEQAASIVTYLQGLK